MVRRYSRKKIPMKRVLSKKVYNLSGGGGHLTAQGTQYFANTTRYERDVSSKLSFSDSMKRYDTMRKMIEELKYDGTNLARFNERKDKARTLREKAVSILRERERAKGSKTGSMNNKMTILINKYRYAIGSIRAFLSETNISILTENDDDEIRRLVVDCRKSALEAIQKTLNKDIDYLQNPR